MSDSSFEGEVESVCSGEELKFSSVPYDLDLTFKIKNNEGKTYRKINYRLKKGTDLPYNVEYKGLHISFDASLMPAISNMTLMSKDGSNVVFQDSVKRIGSPSNNNSEEIITINADLATNSIEELIIRASPTDAEDSPAPFKCPFCDFKFVSMKNTREHIELLHNVPAFEEGIVTVTSPVSNSGIDPCTSRDKENIDPKVEKTTYNSDFLKDFQENFDEHIIQEVGKPARDAIKNNEDILNPLDRGKVMTDILGAVVKFLRIYFKSDNPRKVHAKQIVEYLATVYPEMFKNEKMVDGVPFYRGYGLGGLKGLKGLPDRICNLYRDKYKGKKKREMETDESGEEEPPLKKGRTRRRRMYGVNNNKFYGGIASKTGLENLRLAGKFEQYEKREDLFDGNRLVVQKLMSDQSKQIQSFCPGFWRHHGHVERHFQWVAETSISKKIKDNILGHLDNLESYLYNELKKRDVEKKELTFVDRMDRVKEECHLLYNGSLVHQYIFVLREAGDFWDGKGSVFMRLKEDGPPDYDSPHIFAVFKPEVGYTFELWVERQGLLFDLDLAQCIAAFLHLCFCFGLKYPRESETVCDFLQRVVADYGNHEEGTMTLKKEATAKTKLLRYKIELGNVLGLKAVMEKRANFSE